MALKSIRLIFILSFIAIMCSTLLPTGYAYALAQDPRNASLPSLDAFIEQLKNSRAEELRGIYVPDILAASLVQQPAGMDGFVSPWQDVLTQFSLASRLGSTGILAHNDQAGKSFALLQDGQEFYLVYGDGRITTFIVSEILRYQVLDPDNPSSTFISMENGEVLTSSELFTKVYNRPGRVIFQTCIERNDILTSGRLFVIAEPASH